MPHGSQWFPVVWPNKPADCGNAATQKRWGDLLNCTWNDLLEQPWSLIDSECSRPGVCFDVRWWHLLGHEWSALQTMIWAEVEVPA